MEKKSELELRHELIIEHGLKHVLSTEEGRAWYYNLLGICGVFRSEVMDTNVMFFEAGKRNLGLMLMGEAEFLDPDLFIKMQIEATNRKKEIAHGYTNTSDRAEEGRDSGSTEHKFNSLI